MDQIQNTVEENITDTVKRNNDEIEQNCELLTKTQFLNANNQFMTEIAKRTSSFITILFLVFNLILCFLLSVIFRDLYPMFILLSLIGVISILFFLFLTKKKSYLITLIMAFELSGLIFLRLYIFFRYVKLEIMTIAAIGILAASLFSTFIYFLAVQRKENEIGFIKKFKTRYIALIICLIISTATSLFKMFLFYYVPIDIIIFLINYCVLCFLHSTKVDNYSFNEYDWYVFFFIFSLILIQDIFDNAFITWPFMKDSIMKIFDLRSHLYIYELHFRVLIDRIWAF